MEQKKTETDKTYWHPAFFADIQIELAEDVTGKYPKTLIRHLREERHYSLKKTEPGIYLVQGDFLPIQIIVTRKLSKQKNLWLKSLTNKLDTASAQNLIADYLVQHCRNNGEYSTRYFCHHRVVVSQRCTRHRLLPPPCVDKNNVHCTHRYFCNAVLAHPQNKLYQSVITTIMRANQKIFQEVNSMDDIVMEIVQEKFDRKLKETVDREVKKKVEIATEEVTQQVTQQVTKQVTQKTKLMDLIALIQKKCIKNKPLSVIADELEAEPNELLPVYNIVFQNPDKSIDELYSMVAK